jgi:cytochrome P450
MRNFFDQNDSQFLDDPYHYLNTLRDTGCTSTNTGGKIFFTFDNVNQVISDKDHSVRYIPNQINVFAKMEIPYIKSLSDLAIVFTDPPLHHRLRRLHMVAFSKNQIDQFKELINNQIISICNPVFQKEGAIDVVSELAHEIPKRVLSKMLGIDNDRADNVCDKLMQVRKLLEPSHLTPRLIKRLENEFKSCVITFKEIISEKKISPGNDIITILSNREISEDKLNTEEIVISCALTYIAGHETTKSLISSATKLFIENPKEWKKLQDTPSLIEASIDEISRIEPPLHFTTRIAKQSLLIEGYNNIEPGELLLLCIASANRDPSIYHNPDSFNINRDRVRNLSFGSGMHNCIGKYLANTELNSFLNYLLTKNIDLGSYSINEYKWLCAGPTTRSLSTLSISK